MAARDRYSYEVKCPNCGQEGTFHVSEDDYPFMRGPDRTVDHIVGDFTATVSNGVTVNAVCKKCGTAFKG